MTQSYKRIWIHAIWATKERRPLIQSSIEQMLYQFILNQLNEHGCQPRIINGMPDHIHCLFLLSSQISISNIIKQIKGSSSRFINQKNLLPEKFSWQRGYGAYSVSESSIEKIYNYIKYQKRHHQQQSFQQEYNELFESSDS